MRSVESNDTGIDPRGGSEASAREQATEQDGNARGALPAVSSEGYAEFAKELVETCTISDPWIEGRERFRLDPIVLDAATYDRFRAAAEAIGRVHQELCEIVWEEPELLDTFFHLTPYQKLMWLSSGGQWHGIARLDLFVLANGEIQICEMNSDTPSGEAEAVVLNALRRRYHPSLIDPNIEFGDRFCEMLLASRGSTIDDRQSLRIGVVYPTDLPEDLSMITLYTGWLEGRGWSVTHGSPYNLGRDVQGRLTLLGAPIDIMVRHYKTDWWSERLPVWNDQEPYDDPAPLGVEIMHVIESEGAGHVTIVNPLGAVLTQNKLAMAFFWSHIERFSPDSREAIRSYIPRTYRLADVDRATLSRSEWVLKSDYGCEGDEVILGPFVSDDIWSRSLEAALPHRWIAQRYFEAQPLEEGLVPNFGLYLIAGEAYGIFTRLAPKATDYRALSAPTFIDDRRETT